MDELFRIFVIGLIGKRYLKSYPLAVNLKKKQLQVFYSR